MAFILEALKIRSHERAIRSEKKLQGSSLDGAQILLKEMPGRKPGQVSWEKPQIETSLPLGCKQSCRKSILPSNTAERTA